MPSVFGPSFAAELAAAGLAGLPFGWGDDGTISNRNALSAPQQAALDAVIAAHDPEPAASPAGFPLTARQIRLGLIRHGVPLATVQAAIDGIADAGERDEAQVYWEFSTVVRWDHEMTQGLLALTGIAPEDAEAMWMAAKDYEA